MLDETMALEGVLFSGVPERGLRRHSRSGSGGGRGGRVAEFWSRHSVVPLGSGVSDSAVGDSQAQGVQVVDVTTLAPWLAENEHSCC